MKVSFKARGKRVSFTAKPVHHKAPKQLRKFLFKPGTKRLQVCLRKARKAHRAWLRSR